MKIKQIINFYHINYKVNSYINVLHIVSSKDAEAKFSPFGEKLMEKIGPVCPVKETDDPCNLFLFALVISDITSDDD